MNGYVLRQHVVFSSDLASEYVDFVALYMCTLCIM